MDSKLSKCLISLPIDGRMIAKAEKLSKSQRHPEKARQIYLNALATLAVDFYCQCLDVETDLAKSGGLNEFIPSLLDTGGLCIKDKGLLECRPVLPESDFCYVPAEVSDNRIAYMPVEINEIERKATILGFVQSVYSGNLPLKNLQSLEEFLFYLHKLQKPKLANIEENIEVKIEEAIIKLNKWFDGLFDYGWQSELAIAKKITPVNVTEKPEVAGAKIIQIVNLSEPVLLILHQSLIQDEVEIVLRLYPASESIFLNDGIKMTLVDENNNPIPQLEKEAKSSNWLQLRFKGIVEDRFGLKISWGLQSVIEQFVI